MGCWISITRPTYGHATAKLPFHHLSRRSTEMFLIRSVRSLASLDKQKRGRWTQKIFSASIRNFDWTGEGRIYYDFMQWSIHWNHSMGPSRRRSQSTNGGRVRNAESADAGKEINKLHSYENSFWNCRWWPRPSHAKNKFRKTNSPPSEVAFCIVSAPRTTSVHRTHLNHLWKMLLVLPFAFAFAFAFRWNMLDAVRCV